MCYVLHLWQWSIFFPITPLHTCGSFTFMVIQIMKLSIRGILWWEQWTQLPPAACEMGWQTLRQMGKPALGRQSNHIHLACFPFSLFMCSAATYQQAGAKEPKISTSHTSTTSANTDTFPEVHLTPQPPLYVPQSKHAPQVSLFLKHNADLTNSHQLEELYEVTKEFCGWGNIYLNLELLIN